MSLLETENEKKLKGHRARLRENDDLTHARKEKAAVFLMCARSYAGESRVNVCAVRMRNAKHLGITLKCSGELIPWWQGDR